MTSTNLSYFEHCSSKMFFLKEILRHKGIGKAWKECMAVEAMTRKEVLRLQEHKLKNLLQHAVINVPFYREIAEQKGLDIHKLKLLDFPVVEKKDIRGNEESFLSDRADISKLTKSLTSGSTGEPFMFYSDPVERFYTYATFWRGLKRYSIRPGDKRVWFKGIGGVSSDNVQYRKRCKLWTIINRCLQIDAYFVGAHPERIGGVLKEIVSYEPEFFHGYPSIIADMALHIKNNNLNTTSMFPILKAVVSESEKLDLWQKELFEEVFKVPVIENYGSVEFGMIAQPNVKGEMVLNDDHVIVETDVDDEAIITNLDSFAFPFIRFKNGDCISLSKKTSKDPAFQIITEVQGRVTERIVLPSGGFLHGLVLKFPVRGLFEWIKSYQFVQTDINTLILKIVPVVSPLPEAIEKQLILDVQKVTGNAFSFSLQYVESLLPTQSGKRHYIVSQVK